MKTTKARINTIKYVITESIRIKNELNVALKNKNFKDFYEKEYGSGLGSIGMTIDSPNSPTKGENKDPRAQIYLSNKSKFAIIHMLTDIINEEKLEIHTTVDEYYSEFKKILYNHIFLDNGNIDAEGCSKILDDTLDNIKIKLGSEDFYFPILANGLGQHEINLGIVSILPKDIVFAEIKMKFGHLVFDRASEFCASPLYPYEHLLKITIHNCSAKRRDTLSKQIANLIVGIIQLFAEYYQINADLLALSLNPYPNYEGFYITKKDNNYNYCFSSKGTISQSAEFWVQFKEDISYDMGIIINQIITHAITPKSFPILVDRLIDAIFIFRSAMQDNDEASKIVKLTTALERLVSTEKGNISSNFRRRVVLLLNICHREENDWNKIAKEMYQYRSSIVHGSWSMYRQNEPLYASKYSELTSKAIISACIVFSQVGLKREDDLNLINSVYDYLSQNEVI